MREKGRERIEEGKERGGESMEGKGKEGKKEGNSLLSELEVFTKCRRVCLKKFMH